MNLLKPQNIAIVLIAAYASLAGAQALNDAQNPAQPLLALDAGWLVSPAEALAFKGEDGFNAQPALRPRAVVPLIDIIKPETVADLKVKAPFAIAVLFKSQADAPIDPSTFKVMYGAFKIDITSRITKYVKVTKEGFALENAQIPAGKHRLTMQVMDEKLRVAERELRLEVE
jgi:hypothetical protein